MSKEVQFAGTVFGILFLLQGIGGLVQRETHWGGRGWYVVLYVTDNGGVQVAVSIVLALLGIFVLYATRKRKQSARGN
jgi:heme/copper-type cytochrome/quinol oxidase subunit 1